MKKILALVGAVSLYASVAAAETPRDTLVVGAKFDDIVSLDPHESFEFTGSEFGSQVYDKLITFDPKNIGPIVGGAAESWTVSPDGRTFTFKIRQGIKFHSGNPLTARDVEYSIHRAVTMNKSPAFIITQFGINKDTAKEAAKATDDWTLVFTTDKKYATSFVLNCLSANVSAVVDSKLVKSNEKDGDWGNTWLKTNAAGSGPFKYVTWRANETLTYERNDAYWGGAPKMRRIVLRHMPEQATKRLAIEKGDVDIARDLQADQVKALEGNKDITVRAIRKSYVVYLGLNQKNEILRKPQVQQALKYLVDYDAMSNTILKGAYAVQQTYIPQGFLGAISDRPYKLDVAKAKQLLAEAGHPNGFDITMDVTNTWPWTEIAQTIQATFAQAGVKVSLIPGDFRATITKYRARNHDIYMGRWGSDFLDPHSNADTFAKNVNNADDAPAKPLAWRNAWQNKELTDLTDAAMVESDTEKRRQLYESTQRKFVQVSPFVMMFQNTELLAERKNVTGFILGPLSETTFFKTVEKN
ncbi:MAG: ABC transporter substrate-binding protein [Rhodospirillales bacterium]|nr:ABC transporter substrate-binding protein [Rhodospirillales bacterium]